MWIDDQVIVECEKDLSVKVWVPSEPIVVLGRSNKLSLEVNIDACLLDKVPVVKRIGGGGTVLLHQHCLVASVGGWVNDFFKNDLYFSKLNQSVIDVLNSGTIEVEFSQRGYSDIVVGAKKIAGTSLFRSKHYFLYQASILVCTGIESIEKYLKHPSLEPSYRQGRSHRDFLMGLSDFSSFSSKEWLQIFSEKFEEKIRFNMASHLRTASLDHLNHVLSRYGEIHSLES